jgi:hypothetical protein
MRKPPQKKSSKLAPGLVAVGNRIRIGVAADAFTDIATVEFIDENGGGPEVRLKK